MTEDHFLVMYKNPLIQGYLVKRIAKIEYFDGVKVYGGHLPRLNLIAKFNFNGEKIKPSECRRRIETIEESISSIEGVSDIKHLGTVLSNYMKDGKSLKIE